MQLFPSRCRGGALCNDLTPTNDFCDFKFPSRFRGARRLQPLAATWQRRSNWCFHPVAGLGALQRYTLMLARVFPGMFPSRCRKRGGCNS